MSISQVKEFHRACGFKAPISPAVPNPESVELRIKLMREELKEIEDAIAIICTNPHVEAWKFADLVKEFADLRYVLDGAIIVFGMADVIDEACDRVHKSNMSKFNPDTLEPYERREDGKIMKGPHYRLPVLVDLFEGTGS